MNESDKLGKLGRIIISIGLIAYAVYESFSEESVSEMFVFTNLYFNWFVVAIFISVILFGLSAFLNKDSKFQNTDIYQKVIAPLSFFLFTIGLFGLIVSLNPFNNLFAIIILLVVSFTFIIIASTIIRNTFESITDKYYVFAFVFLIIILAYNTIIKTSYSFMTPVNFVLYYLSIVEAPKLFYDIFTSIKK